MAAQFTRQEYEQYLADRRKETLGEMQAWLDSSHLQITPCPEWPECDYGSCHGWQLGGRDDDYPSEPAYVNE